jgi:hypothetical protein
VTERSNSNRYTVVQLAKLMSCQQRHVHATADRLRLPYDRREGVDKNGNPIVRRVYLKAPIDAALDEMGRSSQRGAA